MDGRKDGSSRSTIGRGMSEEWIVQVDKDDGLVGKVERDLAHDQKRLKLHREVMVLLYKDSSRVDFLLQLRSMKKRQLPGYWTLSTTGHVDFDDISPSDQEGYLAAANREVNEEIGVRGKDLKLVGKKIQKNEDNWSMMGIVTGTYEGELRLDPEEVSEVKVFNNSSVLEISDKLTPGAKACLKYLGILNQGENL